MDWSGANTLRILTEGWQKEYMTALTKWQRHLMDSWVTNAVKYTDQ